VGDRDIYPGCLKRRDSPGRYRARVLHAPLLVRSNPAPARPTPYGTVSLSIFGATSPAFAGHNPPDKERDPTKTTPLIFGLVLAVGANLLAGAPTADGQFSTPSRKDSPSLSDKDRGPGSGPAGPALESSGRRLLDDTIEILSVTEQKPDASGRRKVTVRVHYALVHYPKGILSLGFNLKSATKFMRVTDHPVEAGTDEIELSATVVPVT